MPDTHPYDSTKPIQRYCKKKKKKFTQSLDEVLSFTTPTDCIAFECLIGMENTKLWKIEADHEKITVFLPSIFARLYSLCQLFSWHYLLFFFPLIVVLNLILALTLPGPFLTELMNSLEFIKISSIGIPISVILITITSLNEKGVITLPNIGFYKLFELNRNTGAVACFHKGEKIYTTPFIYFNCHLRPTIDRTGVTFFSLHLVSQLIENTREIPVSRLVSTEENTREDNYYRIWNTIQWYMDVSRPLPDLPILEKHRSKDPLTAAHDKAIGRKKNFWADMTEEECCEHIERLYYEQKDIVPLGAPLQIQYIGNRQF